MRRTLARAGDGTGTTLFVEAEAGLGKTAVLAHARTMAEAAGLEAVIVRGEEMERALPFGLASSALPGIVEPAADGMLPVALLDPAAPYHRALTSLRARRQPLLLAVDDLHWSDDDSLALVGFVARRLQPLPVALVATLRPWPPAARDLGRDLAGAGVASVEQLEPLSPAGVGRLLADRAGRPVASDVAERAHAMCHGNPLLLEQVAVGLARGEALPTATAVSEHLLLARFAGLDDAGLRCVRTASVLGARFRPDVAADVSGLSETDLDTALEGLVRTGLVVEDGPGTMRFAHPLFARALYDDLAVPIRQRIHARCFAALADRGLEAEAAEHAVRADMIGDARATAVLERAGRAALAAGAVATAAARLESAVRLGAARGSRALEQTLAEALVATGRVEEAVTLCERLLADGGLGWREQIEVQRLLGRALYLTGAPDHGEGALARAAAIAVENGAPELAVQPLLDQSLGAWLAGGPARALPIAERARSLAVHAPPDVRERAEATWGHLAFESGDPSGLAATEPVRERLPSGSLDPLELTWPWASVYQLAMNDNYAGRHAEAAQAFRRIAQTAAGAGAANALATVAIHLANVEIRRGHLHQALDEAARAEELSELTPGVGAYAALARAEALMWLGRRSDSERACREAAALAGDQWFAALWLGHVHGAWLLWDGDDRASERLADVEQLTLESGIREPCHVQWEDHAVAAHLAAGRRDAALRVVAWVEDAGEALPCAYPKIASALGRARLAAHDGDDGAAEHEFRRALALHDDADLPLQRIEALLAYGSWLRRRGRAVHARPRLSSAVRLAETCGAAGLARIAHDELKLAGGRRRRAVEDRDRLTEAEKRVSRLAAAGHSNAAIARALQLSVNTVETHLKHVYAKLGIASRRELMRR